MSDTVGAISIETIIDALDEWLYARANFDALNRIDRETYEDRERLSSARDKLAAALRALAQEKQAP